MSTESDNSNSSVRIESVLLQHPGVRAVAVSREKSPSGELIAYVVPREEYLGRALAEEERKRIQTWRKTFDLMQMGKDAVGAELGFNIAGWNSSYTRQPIPEHEMREWVENTVAEIRALQPQEVLEIGCGTGLLLLRIAPQCKRYVATDFAPAVLEKLRKQMEQIGGSWNGVNLLERSADDFDGLAESSFDTVVINSVTQHFPNFSYLIKVMEGVARVVKPGGKIFVGDVRSLPLLEAYATSVELYQAAPEMPLEELRQRIDKRVRQQEQLVISPAFFLALADRSPNLIGVEIRLKRGRSANELTRFRYDVILHAGVTPSVTAELEWRDWANEEGIEGIRRMLRDQKSKRIAISGIRNARIDEEARAIDRLSHKNEFGTANELRRELQLAEHSGIEPEDLRSVAEDAGSRVKLSWANCRRDGSYDGVFSRIESAPEGWTPVNWPQPSTTDMEFGNYTNTPGQHVFRERLVRQLLSYSKEHLPDEMVPHGFVLVDSLP